MGKKLIILIFFVIVHMVVSAITPDITVATDGSGNFMTIQAAFPGAEGHGKYVTGGRSGRVIYVTNLNDDNNPGSLRHAINQTGPRFILFKVSGTIRLTQRLNISNGDVTIAGQTAPGDGITLRDYPVVVDANNVIIRYLRFRMGDAAAQEGDALGGREMNKIIIDHCSMSWSTDECVSFYQNQEFTLQWCIISESLRNSVHNKGAHGYGGIWGGKNASFHHNLLAHHDSRNPRLGENNGSPFALSDLIDLRNNVIYNWAGNSCYGGEAMNANIINCYYKPGPGTSGTTKKERIIAIDKELETGYPTTGIWGKYYIDGNYMAGSARATADNWNYGVYPQFHSNYGTVPETDKIAMRLSAPLNAGEVTTHTAENAYVKVLDYAGASLVRDTIDRRIIKDVRTGTATYMAGGNGSVNGIIDTQSAVGGWPELSSLPAPTDSDSDGMPDDWEVNHGLDKNSPSDAQTVTVDGKYPNVEVYINSLVSDITENQVKDAPVTSSNYIKKEDNPVRLYLAHPGLLKIDLDLEITRVDIFSVTGTLIKSHRFCKSSAEMDVNSLKSGIYFVRILDNQQKVYSAKFINN
jgi:hypothetical protein